MANAPTIWTVEMIKAKLATNDVMVERSLLVIYANQTADEKSAQTTNHTNGKGFNGTDAGILSSFAEWAIKMEKSGKVEGTRLSPKQREIARRKLMKYTKQLLAKVAG
jgi:hypothetical protein